MKTLNSTKVVASRGKPTLFFLVNDDLQQLMLLDGEDPKKLSYRVFETFMIATNNLVIYEV